MRPTSGGRRSSRATSSSAARRHRGYRDPGITVLGADGVGAKCANAAAGVSAHRDGRGGGPAGCGRRGTGVGERRRFVVRVALGDDSGDRPRRLRRLAGAARVGEQRPDDVLLLRPRARGASRVRSRRSAGTATVCLAAARRDRRHGAGGRHLSRLQRWPLLRAGLGNRNVHRHRLRARAAGARRPAFPRPAAGVHAHGRRRRRHPRARRHRHRLHGAGHRLRRSLRHSGCSAPCSSRGRWACGSGSSTSRSEWRSGWRCSNPGSSRWWSGSRWGSWPTRTRPRAPSSNAQPSASASSASSRPRSSPAPSA